MTAKSDNNYARNTSGSIDFSYVRFSQKLRLIFAGLAFLLVCIIYSGYIFNIERLYRLIPAGSATHELTALCVGLLSIAVFFESLTRKNQASFALAGIVAILSTLRIIEFSINGNFISDLTPFHEVADTAIRQGFSHSMGINTAIAILVFSLSILLRHTKPYSAFFIGSIAPFILVSSMVGYTYDAERLHGAMSINTTLVFLPLCLALLMLWVHYPFARGFFANSPIGQSARLQLLLAVLFPWLGGLSLIRMETNITIFTFALYSTALSWATMGLIISSTIQLERKDRVRRSNERKLFYLSTTDMLTGCFSRRIAAEFGQHAVMQALRNGNAISVMMIDIDDFKRINDTYGHQKGDEVIQSVAKIVKRNLRNTDIVARWGGEEFVVLLHDCKCEDARQVAEKIRSEIETMNLQADVDYLPKTTISIGYTTYEKGPNNFSNLLKCADDAMYFAKKSGKNRVIQYADKLEIPVIS
jgi:diguanylate cyclase (GGDEF)-like protein